jgi:lysine-N-methylase
MDMEERRLSHSTPIRPEYAEQFHCIGSACEDTCCQGWSIPIEKKGYEQYVNLPIGPLRKLIQENLVVIPPDATCPKPAPYAAIKMDADNQCPMLNQEKLCSIQVAYGADYLSHTCAIYPRIVNSVNGVKEMALTLSCPEAARLVLLHPGLLDRSAASQDGPLIASIPANPVENAFSPRAWFWSIRDAALTLIQNRNYPLWQRMFLLGVFSRRLDSISKGELLRPVPDFLRDFQVSVASGSLLPAMETLPVDRKAQLDVVLQLAGMLLHRSNVRPRFIACIEAFTSGIGNGPQATLDSLAANYALAHDRHYTPFFDRHPHILENYLINTVFRCHFPLGKAGAKPELMPDMTKEFALLTAQFALMKGLLIGVAGHYRESFSETHVVDTIQAAAKHFEHHPEFLNQAHALLVESQMDGARGLAILLRNTGPSAPKSGIPAVHVPGPQAVVPA